MSTTIWGMFLIGIGVLYIWLSFLGYRKMNKEIKQIDIRIAKNKVKIRRNIKLMELNQKQMELIDEEIARSEAEGNDYDEGAARERYERLKAAYEEAKRKIYEEDAE